MTLAENLAFRNFDVEPHAVGGWLINHHMIRRSAQSLIEQYQYQAAVSPPPYPIAFRWKCAARGLGARTL